MLMSNIKVDLEMAKRLKENGWEKETHFIEEEREDIEWYSMFKDDWYMPTAQEILDELPAYISDGFWNEVWIMMEKNEDGSSSCEYLDYETFRWSNLANALAELRIRCKKHWYIE